MGTIAALDAACLAVALLSGFGALLLLALAGFTLAEALRLMWDTLRHPWKAWPR
jgi:hypothetical protein